MPEPTRCPHCGEVEDDTARAWCCWERMEDQQRADAEQAARPAGDEPREHFRNPEPGAYGANTGARGFTAAHVGQRDGGAAGDDTAPVAGGNLVVRNDGSEVLIFDPKNDDKFPWRSIWTRNGWGDAYPDAEGCVPLAAAAPRAGADTVRWMHDHTIVAAYDGGTGETREVGQAVGRYDHPTYVIRLADGSRFVWSEQLVREATEDERATYAAFRESVRVLNQADQGSGGSVPRAPVEALLAALYNDGAYDADRPQVLDAVAEVRRHLDGDEA